MTDEKGYIQFSCQWEQTPTLAHPRLDDLVRWRNRLRQLDLIGVYPNGVGFGNLSARIDGQEEFIISGTATGAVPTCGPEHFTRVLSFDFASNRLHCRGPLQASSESLSHAAVYRSVLSACAVIHVHQVEAWTHLRNKAPTTDATAEAGTPEMARAIEELFKADEVADGFFVMGGHKEGLISLGRTLDEAGERMLRAIGLRSGQGTY